MHRYRSHHCNELKTGHVGQEVKLSGWVHRVRDHGNLLFIDLRDHFGITQCVTEAGEKPFETASNVRVESVVTITGTVMKRDAEAINKTIATGEVEVRLSDFHVESAAEVLPMQVNAERDFPEETRLKYRFLDLRREKLHKNIILRSAVIASLRRRMIEQGFMEFQTPILTASSPEGARDFLVPSRMHPGKFYALPQAPQQFKQLLMVSGFDRYFQIAPCFRDEDARADRSPGEFYQLDIEMSFVTQEDVFAAIEPVLEGVFKEFGDKVVTPAPFPHITYRDAMLYYGSDKPDLRNPLKLADVTEVFEDSDFDIFAKAIANGQVVRAVPAPQTSERPRSFFDSMNDWAREQGAPGMGYIIFGTDGAAKGPIAKFLNEERLAKLKELTGMGAGDAVFFAAGKTLDAAKLAGKARDIVCDQLGLREQGIFKFCWVVDFPFYEENEDTGQIEFSHNPFSMPQGGMDALLNQNPLDIVAHQYDIVCNGVELSSGAIRNHKPEIMLKAFEIAGYSADVVEEKFGGMLRAFRFGAPPHGGLAPGVDRMVMLIADEPNIREIIAFPMNQQAEDILMGAPCEATEKQLRELNIQLSPKARQVLAEEKEKPEAA
jgi:aspartyl-tRNA synthetase